MAYPDCSEAKTKKFIVGKACSGEWVKGLVRQPFGEAIRHVTNGFTQPPQQKPRKDMEHPGKIYGGFSCLMAQMPMKYMEDPQCSMRM